ncbi:hypothetical protein MKW92_022755 [Papaver armeniacum]|nr:hypothetical protein MKW92_022755 [Papaver armeniacum]
MRLQATAIERCRKVEVVSKVTGNSWGYGNAVELALTARRFTGEKAKDLGIAMKSQLTVIGTKEVLLRSRDMSLDQGLDYVATWNSTVLPSADLTEAVSTQTKKRKPTFAKL